MAENERQDGLTRERLLELWDLGPDMLAEGEWEYLLDCAKRAEDSARLTFVLEHLVIYDEYGFAKANGMDDTRRIYDTREAIDQARKESK